MTNYHVSWWTFWSLLDNKECYNCPTTITMPAMAPPYPRFTTTIATTCTIKRVIIASDFWCGLLQGVWLVEEEMDLLCDATRVQQLLFIFRFMTIHFPSIAPLTPILPPSSTYRQLTLQYRIHCSFQLIFTFEVLSFTFPHEL